MDVPSAAPAPPAAAEASNSAYALKKRSMDKVTASTREKRCRGCGYSSDETMWSLHNINNILPLCQMEWKSVLAQHNKKYNRTRREVESLKQKFNKLSNTKILTGDPNCPKEVKFAKHIISRIQQKAEISHFGSDSEKEFGDLYPSDSEDVSDISVRDDAEEEEEDGVEELGMPSSIQLEQKTLAEERRQKMEEDRQRFEEDRRRYEQERQQREREFNEARLQWEQMMSMFLIWLNGLTAAIHGNINIENPVNNHNDKNGKTNNKGK